MNRSQTLSALLGVAVMCLTAHHAEAKWYKKALHAVEKTPDRVVHTTVQTTKVVVSKAGDKALDTTNKLPVPMPGRGVVRHGFHEVLGQ
jgi:hypothetical protein